MRSFANIGRANMRSISKRTMRESVCFQIVGCVFDDRASTYCTKFKHLLVVRLAPNTKGASVSAGALPDPLRS